MPLRTKFARNRVDSLPTYAKIRALMSVFWTSGSQVNHPRLRQLVRNANLSAREIFRVGEAILGNRCDLCDLLQAASNLRRREPRRSLVCH